jgi:hypothetical protein
MSLSMAMGGPEIAYRDTNTAARLATNGGFGALRRDIGWVGLSLCSGLAAPGYCFRYAVDFVSRRQAWNECHSS